MKKFMFTKIFLLFVLFAAYSKAFQLGHCPYVRPQTDLKVSDFLGTWYEHAKYLITAESLSNCITLTIEKSAEAELTFVRTLTGKLTGIQVGYTGAANLVRPGVLELKADGVAGIFANSNFTILGTDYSNYAVAFACEELLSLGIVHNRYAFVLTRQRQPSPEVVNSAEDALKNNGLSVRDLILTNQRNCTHGH